MPDSPRLTDVQRREAELHDALAAEMPLRPEKRTYDPWFYNRTLVEAAEPLAGMRVLELGCGDGESTAYLLERGAKVTAIDISAGMVDLARRRIALAHPDADVRFDVAPAEDTGLDSGSFDRIVGRWVLHHLDLAEAAREIDRLLAPGGRGVFIENSAFNPVMMFARERVVHRGRLGTTAIGTPDEHPMTRADVRAFGSHFARYRVDQPDFVLLHMIPRYFASPRARWPHWLWLLDKWLGEHVPALAPLSYVLRLVVEK